MYVCVEKPIFCNIGNERVYVCNFSKKLEEQEESEEAAAASKEKGGEREN